DSFFLLDREWRFLYLSPKAERFLKILGMRRGSLVGQIIWDILPQTRESEGYRLFSQAMEGRRGVDYEEYYGPLKTWFAVNVYPVGEGLAVYLRDITRRKLAEAAFLKLSNAVEQTDDAVFITDRGGYIEYVNPAFEEITGHKRSDVLGKTPYFLKAEDVRDSYFENVWANPEQLQTFQATLLNVRKSGEEYFADETVTPVKHANGVITHFVSTMRDITERKTAEDTLRKSEERFRALVEHSSDGLILLDPDGTILYSGPTTLRIIGYTTEEIVGRNGFEFLPQEEQTPLRTALRELLQEPRSTRLIQFRLRHKKGDWRWMEATANNLLGEPSIGGIVLNYRDITDRKNIEEALLRSEIEYRNLFEQANDAIFIFEPEEEVILEANTKACSMYGFTKDEFIGMSLKQITKDVARGEEQIRILLRQQSGRNFETVHFSKDGRPMEMLVNSSVVDYAGRKVIMSICRDMSELKKLEHQLRHAQKMEGIGTLAGGIAHDFNNILSIILGYTSLIRRGRIDSEKMPESLEAITKAAQRGATLVRQILTFARKTEVVFESVSVNDIINDLIKLLSETFPKTIVFTRTLEEKIPSIVADSNQLHQVFLNLCVNARDAMPKGGTISITSETVSGSHLVGRFPDAKPTEYVHIAFTDTGTGMSESTRSRIFEPFFTTKGQGTGTGLGLAVVYGIVNNHHGFIDLHSQMGAGTTFHMYFPVQMRTMDSLRLEEEELEDAPGGTETILLAEDEEMLLHMVQRLLESKGYRVLAAIDGEQAMTLFEQYRNDIALILTDIGLPKLSGWEVCRKIMESDP
ncbi:MAG: PAS domain S-box protein, partial [Bacteroidota bacterium]